MIISCKTKTLMGVITVMLYSMIDITDCVDVFLFSGEETSKQFNIIKKLYVFIDKNLENAIVEITFSDAKSLYEILRSIRGLSLGESFNNKNMGEHKIDIEALCTFIDYILREIRMVEAL